MVAIRFMVAIWLMVATRLMIASRLMIAIGLIMIAIELTIRDWSKLGLISTSYLMIIYYTPFRKKNSCKFPTLQSGYMN